MAVYAKMRDAVQNKFTYWESQRRGLGDRQIHVDLIWNHYIRGREMNGLVYRRKNAQLKVSLIMYVKCVEIHVEIMTPVLGAVTGFGWHKLCEVERRSCLFQSVADCLKKQHAWMMGEWRWASALVNDISRDRGETPRLANYRLRYWMVSKILCSFATKRLKCTRKREKDVPIAIILIQPCQRGRNWSDGRKNQAIWSFWGRVAMATHSLYTCVRKTLFLRKWPTANMANKQIFVHNGSLHYLEDFQLFWRRGKRCWKIDRLGRRTITLFYKHALMSLTDVQRCTAVITCFLPFVSSHWPQIFSDCQTCIAFQNAAICVEPVRISHISHDFGWQSSHSVDLAGWQAKMAVIEIWKPWRDVQELHQSKVTKKACPKVIFVFTFQTF